MVRKGSSPEQVLVELRKRVIKGSDLHTAKLIVNTIGRLPGGGGLIRKYVTQELISTLSRKVQHAR